MGWIIYLISFIIVFLISYSGDDLKRQKGRFIVSLFYGIFFGGGLTYLISQILLIFAIAYKVISKIF